MKTKITIISDLSPNVIIGDERAILSFACRQIQTEIEDGPDMINGILGRSFTVTVEPVEDKR